MTAVPITDSFGGVAEGQVPRWTGRSLERPPPASMGRERELAPANSGHSAVSWLGDVQPTTPEDRSSLDTGHCRGRAAW